MLIVMLICKNQIFPVCVVVAKKPGHSVTCAVMSQLRKHIINNAFPDVMSEVHE